MAKGKSKKIALIGFAAASRCGGQQIFKQAFAIAKSGWVYDENYRSINPLCKKK